MCMFNNNDNNNSWIWIIVVIIFIIAICDGNLFGNNCCCEDRRGDRDEDRCC